MRRVMLMAGGALAAAIPWHGVELGSSVRSTWTAPATMIVTDSAAFRRAWVGLFDGSTARPPLPVVRFATERVIVVAAGNRPTGGFSIRFDSAAMMRDSAMVWVTLHAPPPGCGVTQEITTPAVAIAIPRLPAPLRVVTRARPDSASCNRHP